MNFLKKLNENYFVYAILFFTFIPLNFLPQLFDGVAIDYVYNSDDKSALVNWYKEASRFIHLALVFIIDFLVKYTQLPSEIFFDNITVLFLILFCFEVKKYSKIFFNLEERWCNLSALFAAIIPIWHTLVAFNIGQYVSSFYFLLFGYRYFVSKNKIKVILGLIFIVLSFDVESNLSFVIGLALVSLILKETRKTFNISYFKFTLLLIICLIYYFFVRNIYFPPSGLLENYNTPTFESFSKNIFSIKFVKNIYNYSTFLLPYLLIPLIFILNLAFINDNFFSKIKLKLKNKYKFTYFYDYFLLLILAGFAIAPYLLLGKSPSLFYLSDYFQRHAFLLAPIFGIFFSIMFRDLEKINCLASKANLSLYLIAFVAINLVLLNYGNYRKVESYLYRINLINEFKNYGAIPQGNALFIGKNLPADLRSYELNYIMYKSYNKAGWWTTPYHPIVNKDPKFPPSFIKNDKNYLKLYVSDDYKYECALYIYIKNDMTKLDRFKKFYIFNYKKYYNIDKIVKKC